MFISFEGPEGAGKSTQIERLASSLRSEGRAVRVVREPGSTALGEKIRAILLTPTAHSALETEAELSDRAEALLFAAARAQLVDEVVKPSLSRGETVLVDRFSDSTRAYQVSARGLPAEPVDRLIEFATGGLEPDLTFLLDLDVRIGLARKRGTGDRLERQDFEFHQRVRAAYCELARAYPNRIVALDANCPADELAARIRAIVSTRLSAVAARPTALAAESPNRQPQEGDSAL